MEFELFYMVIGTRYTPIRYDLIVSGIADGSFMLCALTWKYDNIYHVAVF